MITDISIEENCKFQYLAVLSRNKDAISMYKHWGFKQTAMIYNLTLKDDFQLQNRNKCGSERFYIKKENEVEYLVDDMMIDFFLFNKIYHYFEAFYILYKENNGYSRRINKKNIIGVINIKKNNELLYFIFLINYSQKNIEVIEDELLEIRNSNKYLKKTKSIFGKLTKDEINKLEQCGIKFETAFEYKAYMLEI